MASSKSVVIAALVANADIAVLKFVGFTLTESPAMLSETYHSISDTGNQVFLPIGIRYSERTADRAHPFGYGKAQFFYSFLVSVLLFGIAGWESAKQGFEAILNPHSPDTGTATIPFTTISFDAVFVNYSVLLGAILFEFFALRKAYAGLTRQMQKNDWESLWEAFQNCFIICVRIFGLDGTTQP